MTDEQRRLRVLGDKIAWCNLACIVVAVALAGVFLWFDAWVSAAILAPAVLVNAFALGVRWAIYGRVFNVSKHTIGVHR